MNSEKQNRSYATHKEYLALDAKRYKKLPSLIDKILCNESWYKWNFTYHLRCVEYYYGKRGINRILYLYHFILYKRLGFKLKWMIRPFSVGPGFYVYHIGDFIHIGDNAKVGKNFSCQCGVVLSACNGNPIVIGDDVTLHLGVKVIKPITIGNNVEVGAMAVVTHDVPNNAILAGIPAKIIKMKQ